MSSSSLSSSSPPSSLFDTPLHELVKGVRAHRRDEAAYITSQLEAIQRECASSDAAVKAHAVLKLTYLQQHAGRELDSASFHIVETMSRPVFWQKRVGYLAASLSFGAHTDVLLLTTNLLKKDLRSARAVEQSLALSGIASFVTADLARDVWSDVAALLNSSRPYLRKKAVLVLHRCLVRFPEALHAAFPKLVAALDDGDPAVVCAAVTVVLELAKRAPENYLPLAPSLYKILTTGTNNWVLIKVVKLLGMLCPLEPRLGRKIATPLVDIMKSTHAKSLLFECCCTVTAGLWHNEEATAICSERLAEFAVDSDQNLKYLALRAMRGLAERRPEAVARHRSLILACLDDADASIRLRALELVCGMVDSGNVRATGDTLLRYMHESGLFGDAVCRSVLCVASGAAADMQHAAATTTRTAATAATAEALDWRLQTRGDFEWFVRDVLLVMGLERDALSDENAQRVGALLVDIAVRVDAVRAVAVEASRQLLQRVCAAANDEAGARRATAAVPRAAVVSAAAWILGQYADGDGDAELLLAFARCVVDGSGARPEALVALAKLAARRVPLPADMNAQLETLAESGLAGVTEIDRWTLLRKTFETSSSSPSPSLPAEAAARAFEFDEDVVPYGALEQRAVRWPEDGDDDAVTMGAADHSWVLPEDQVDDEDDEEQEEAEEEQRQKVRDALSGMTALGFATPAQLADVPVAGRERGLPATLTTDAQARARARASPFYLGSGEQQRAAPERGAAPSGEMDLLSVRDDGEDEGAATTTASGSGGGGGVVSVSTADQIVAVRQRAPLPYENIPAASRDRGGLPPQSSLSGDSAAVTDAKTARRNKKTKKKQKQRRQQPEQAGFSSGSCNDNHAAGASSSTTTAAHPQLRRQRQPSLVDI